VLAEHRGDPLPAVDPAQLDLPTHQKGQQQDDGGVLIFQKNAPSFFSTEVGTLPLKVLEALRICRVAPLRYKLA
jgi:hypothetical protein